MTERERMSKTLKLEKIGGRVPHFELEFFLTMEAFGRVHPSQLNFYQWGQMSAKEKSLHLNSVIDTHIAVAEKYKHSAIFLHPNPSDFNSIVEALTLLREKSGDEYFVMIHGDTTFSIPDGDEMMEFSYRLYHEKEKLHEEAKRRLDRAVERIIKTSYHKGLLDCYALCSDYCFNTNPFFSDELFAEFITPYLKELIDQCHRHHFFAIKHTDGNIMPILDAMLECKPDALHSLDPQGGVDLKYIKEHYGDKVCLIGNVNCGLLQTGSLEEVEQDVMRSLRDGMSDGKGYIFSTSNCVYTGLDLERYEYMHKLWQQYGVYE